MADNKNMALNDEAMAKATGGVGEDAPVNKYNVRHTDRMVECTRIRSMCP